MDFDHLLRGFAVVPGHKVQVGAHVAAVEDGDLQHLTGGNGHPVQLVQQAPEPVQQGGVPDDLRVVVDHQGAIGGYGLHDAGNAAAAQGDIEGPDFGVEGWADLVAELHTQGGVPRGEKSYVCHGLLLSPAATQSGRWGQWRRPPPPAGPGCA